MDGNPEMWMQSIIRNPACISLEVAPIFDLNLSEYISDSVQSNLKKAILEYCDKLVKEGKMTNCDPLEGDDSEPKPRTWSGWSNDNSVYNYAKGIEHPEQVCDEGQYIKSIRWKEWAGYGLVDFQMKCSNSDQWMEPAIGNFNHNGMWVTQGTWNKDLSCPGLGFGKIIGMEQTIGLIKGLVNVQASCAHSSAQVEMTSNDQVGDEFNPDLSCEEGQQIVGLQIREELYHGIIGFRVLCA